MFKEFSDLAGQTLRDVLNIDDEQIIFELADGDKYDLSHNEECCEDVMVEDICGDLADLVGTPILLAEEVTHENVNPEGVPSKEYQDSFTWTFYKLSTIKGSVTIRWYGESNGYYSESVDFAALS